MKKNCKTAQFGTAWASRTLQKYSRYLNPSRSSRAGRMMRLGEEYESFQHGGIIFGYYADDGECAGILTMKPYEPGKHPVKYPSDAKVMYLSDVATRFEYRNQGIGTHLFEHAIRHLEVLGYDYIYLRTNEENSMSYGIAKRCGFVQLFDIIEEVERRRTDGTVAKDARIFMEKKLSK